MPIKYSIDRHIIVLITLLLLSESVAAKPKQITINAVIDHSGDISQQPAITSSDSKARAAEKAYQEGLKLYQQGTPKSLRQAIEKYQQALKLYRALADKTSEALTLNNIGFSYSALEEQQKALEYYGQALPLMRSLAYSGGSTRGGRNLSGETLILTNIGTIYDSLSDKQKAIIYYQQILPIMQQMQNIYGEAQILNNLALIYDFLGEKQKTLDYLNKALLLWRKLGDLPGEAFTVNTMGIVYDSLGDKQQALQYYNEALMISRTARDDYKEAIALNNIGLVYNSLGKSQRGLEYLNKALRFRRKLGDEIGEAQTLNNIGLVYHDLDKKQQAIIQYQQALLIWRAQKSVSGEALTLNNIALAYNELGKKQAALIYLQEALPLWRKVGHYSGEALTLSNIAYVEREKGNLKEALTQIEVSIGIIDSLRTKITSPQLRSSYFATVQDRYKFYIDLLMQLHKTNPSQGYDIRALTASEKSRARSLIETLSEAKADIRNGVDPILLEKERNLQQQLSNAEENRVKLLSSNYTEAQKTAIETKIETLLNQSQENSAQIRSRSPRYAALTQPQPLNLREIQQQVLDDNTVLLEYSLGAERSYLWAVTKTGITTYELPKVANLEMLVKRLNEQELVPPHLKKNSKISEILSQILLQPVANLIVEKRLLIVSDGALQYIPFSALPSPKVQGDKEKFTSPLIVKHEIINLPSASTLGILRREIIGRKPVSKTIAILADPVFSANDPRVKKSPEVASISSTHKPNISKELVMESKALSRAALESDVNLNRLDFTRKEAEAIMALLPAQESKQTLDFAANRSAAISTDLAQYKIVHFATHGILNSAHPELSGIVLSLFDEKGNPQNGFLRLHDIFNMNLPVELVVLSACKTGLGTEIKGEGLIGLTRGFMYAGAPRVVVSLWNVNDQATSELMRRFYQKILLDKLAPAAALRSAQIEMLNTQWKSSYYWAAFVIQGEWN